MTDVVRDPYGNPLRQDTKIAALRQARIDALEEAAKVCDPKGDCSEQDAYGAAFAAAIRAMKGKQ